jgi:hypothetical protein
MINVDTDMASNRFSALSIRALSNVGGLTNSSGHSLLRGIMIRSITDYEETSRVRDGSGRERSSSTEFRSATVSG